MSFLTIRTLLFAAECLAASLLLPMLAFAATRLVRRAALRHLVWLTMFGVLALLPLAALLLPARQIVLTEPASVAAPAPMESIIALPPVEMMEPLPEAPGEKRIAAPDFNVGLLPAPAMAAPAPVSAQPLLTIENALLLLVLLWAAGLAWNLGRMLLGGFGLMRLRREGELFRQDAFEIRLSPAVTGPATFGILCPLVLLPATARQWSPARLAAVLAHEAAHVRRRDIAGQSLARLVCAVFWFNPLLWLAARALRHEAELAADDVVLAGGMTPSDYAAELVALAAEILRPSPALRALGAGMADSPLMVRVQSVLAANVSRKGVTSMDIARMLSLGLGATLLLGTARIDLALAQEKPANPAPAAQAAPAARPAPAAPPAQSASPKIDIEAAPKVDVEVEAIKARADAAAAEARQVDALAIGAARALASVEQARKAAQAVADMQVQRGMARAGSSADAIAAARSLAAIEQAEIAARKVASDSVGDAMRQRMAQSTQQTREAQQHAREAEQRALEAKAQADEAQRRMREETQKESRATGTYRVSTIFLAVLRPDSDTKVKAEIEAIEKQIRGGASFRDLARQHSQDPAARQGGDLGWVAANQLEAPLRAVVTGLQVGELSRPVRARGGWYLLGLQDRQELPGLQGRPVDVVDWDQARLEEATRFATARAGEQISTGYTVRRFFRSHDVNVSVRVTAPLVGSLSLPLLSKVDAVIDAAMAEATGKIDAALAEGKGTPAALAGGVPGNGLLFDRAYQGNGMVLAVAINGSAGAPVPPVNREAVARMRAAIEAQIDAAGRTIDAAITEVKAASRRP